MLPKFTGDALAQCGGSMVIQYSVYEWIEIYENSRTNVNNAESQNIRPHEPEITNKNKKKL